MAVLLKKMNDDFVKGECPQCSGRIEVPATAIGQSFNCPHCGQSLELLASLEFGKSSRRRLWLVLALMALVCVLLAGAGALFIIHRLPGLSTIVHPASPPAKTNSAAAQAPPVPNKPAADAPRPGELLTNSFGISGGTLEKLPGSSIVYVTGHVRNFDSHQRFGVKVMFTLLDDNGQSIGHATDYHPVLDAHGDWSFKAMVMESKAASAEFSGITEEK